MTLPTIADLDAAKAAEGLSIGDDVLHLFRRQCDGVATAEEKARLQALTGGTNMAKRERSQEYKDKRNAAKRAARAGAAKPVKKAAAPKRRKPAPSLNGNGKPHSERPSLVNAAAKALAEHDHPLTVAELYAVIVEKGYWQSGNGKTPERTLAARIGTEISAGKASRFKRAERGKFELVKA